MEPRFSPVAMAPVPASLVREARSHDGVVETARLQVLVGDRLGPEIVMQALGPPLRLIDGNRAQHDEAAERSCVTQVSMKAIAPFWSTSMVFSGPVLEPEPAAKMAARQPRTGVSHRLLQVADPAFARRAAPVLRAGKNPESWRRADARLPPASAGTIRPVSPFAPRNHNLHRRLRPSASRPTHGRRADALQAPGTGAGRRRSGGRPWRAPGRWVRGSAPESPRPARASMGGSSSLIEVEAGGGAHLVEARGPDAARRGESAPRAASKRKTQRSVTSA